MTTLTNRHYDKNLLFILMIGVLIYFAINSCTPKPNTHITTPTEYWDSIAKAKADSLRSDSLQKAKNDTIHKDSLNVGVDTIKK